MSSLFGGDAKQLPSIHDDTTTTPPEPAPDKWARDPLSNPSTPGILGIRVDLDRKTTSQTVIFHAAALNQPPAP